DFSNTDGTGWGGLSAQVSFAIPITVSGNSIIDFMALGITGKYIAGLKYYEMMESSGRFQNVDYNIDRLSVNMFAKARKADGGAGFGVDFGGIIQAFNNKLVLSVTALNAFGKVKWDKRTEMIEGSLKSNGIQLTTGGFNEEMLIAKDSTYAIEGFETPLPFILDVGVAYRLLRPILLTAEYEHVFHKRMGLHKTSRYAFGMELKIIPFLPLRGGISYKQNSSFAVAAGIGLNLSFWYVDVAVINHGGFNLDQAKGLTLAVTTRLRF
ncbi:MAG: DUF5723 family protein, partial [Calditrichia bacterium]